MPVLSLPRHGQWSLFLLFGFLCLAFAWMGRIAWHGTEWESDAYYMALDTIQRGQGHTAAGINILLFLLLLRGYSGCM